MPTCRYEDHAKRQESKQRHSQRKRISPLPNLTEPTNSIFPLPHSPSPLAPFRGIEQSAAQSSILLKIQTNCCGCDQEAKRCHMLARTREQGHAGKGPRDLWRCVREPLPERSSNVSNLPHDHKYQTGPNKMFSQRDKSYLCHESQTHIHRPPFLCHL